MSPLLVLCLCVQYCKVVIKISQYMNQLLTSTFTHMGKSHFKRNQYKFINPVMVGNIMSYIYTQ